MSKFKRGDKVVRHTYDVDYLMQGRPYCVVTQAVGRHIAVEGNGDGCSWDEDFFELYQEPTQKTFNPKPGDIIVTNNGAKYKCMSREEYRRFGGFSTDNHKDHTIFCWDTTAIDPQYFHHMRWLSADGKVSRDHDFDIKEIIPASKVLAKVEKTYGVSTTADSQRVH